MLNQHMSPEGGYPIRTVEISAEDRESLDAATFITLEIGPGRFPAFLNKFDEYSSDEHIYVGWNPRSSQKTLHSAFEHPAVMNNLNIMELQSLDADPLFLADTFRDNKVDRIIVSNMLGEQHNATVERLPIDGEGLTENQSKNLIRVAEKILKDDGKLVFIETNHPAERIREWGSTPFPQVLLTDTDSRLRIDNEESITIGRGRYFAFYAKLMEYGYPDPNSQEIPIHPDKSYITVLRN